MDKGSRLIGICGKARSGKSTASTHLINNYGFISRPLATPLKEMLGIAFNFTDDQLWGDKKEIFDPRWGGVTPRTAMQFVGTDLFRNQMSQIIPDIGTGFWTHSFRLWYQAHGTKGNVVVDDIRFIDEVDMIRSLGGEILIIERPDLELTETHLHSSEQLDLSTINGRRVVNTMCPAFFFNIDEYLRIKS